MKLPTLSKDDVEKLIKDCTVIGSPKRGGQKLVYPCTLPQGNFAMKFMLVDSISTSSEEEISIDLLDEVSARAKREVDTMRVCTSPFLVKLGPIDITVTTYNEQNIVYFSEELLEGEDLSEEIQKCGSLKINDVVKLGVQIAEAVAELWSNSKIHRDIKPSNILHRLDTGDFVLLDMGMAFDLSDKSLTTYGGIPCTKEYVSPEQLNIAKKRQMDFRSDLFNLGIVMYESITGVHPFCTSRMTTDEIFNAILTLNPPEPRVLRPEIPKELSDIICRLLNKSPNLRYRSCNLLIEELQAIQRNLGGD